MEFDIYLDSAAQSNTVLCCALPCDNCCRDSLALDGTNGKVVWYIV